MLDANSRTAAVYRGSTSRRATVKPRGFETPPLAGGTQRSTENTDGFPWHSYGTPAASKPHQTTPLTSRKWLSQHVASGVEQRINWAFNTLVVSSRTTPESLDNCGASDRPLDRSTPCRTARGHEWEFRCACH